MKHSKDINYPLVCHWRSIMVMALLILGVTSAAFHSAIVVAADITWSLEGRIHGKT
ncbi:MAG: hypothetical protein ABGX16_09090 [Pirellulales bacterium]